MVSEETTEESAQPTTTTETTESPTPTPAPSPTPAEVVVPNVIGEGIQAATKALEAVDLAVVERSKLTEIARKGTVLTQSVAPRTTLEVRRSVVLVVAESFRTIPNVVGDKLTAARRTMENRGFDVRVTRDTSSQPKDTVIRQNPDGGASARPGRTVLVVVAKPAPAPTTDCTSGYSPCLIYHGGADYDCFGGTGDGPYYTKPGVTYRIRGSDPYGSTVTTTTGTDASSETLPSTPSLASLAT